MAVAFGALCPSARAPFVALCMAPPAVAPPASSAAALTSASSSLLEAGKRGKSALPTGLYLGGSCLPVDQVNLGVTTGFSCLPDGNGVASAGAPQNAWLTYGNLLRRCDGVYGQAAEDRLQDVPELPLFE